MGLFEKLFPKPQQAQALKYDGGFKMLTGYEPVFTRFGGDIYESDIVRSAIDARARHISKLAVEFTGPAKSSLMRRLEKGPNGFQTWGQFLYRTSSILDVYNTAVIVPVLDEMGDTTGVYTILPDTCTIVQYKGEPFLRFKFADGHAAAIELNRCGILTKHQLRHEFFGETNKALIPTMELLHTQEQGIKEGVKSAATFRFMAQMGNFATDEDIARERKRFSESNFKSGGGGLLLFPNTFTDPKQIKSDPYVPDAQQMRVIETKVFDYFGVNEDVIQNKAYGDAWAAFYEGAIEPFAIQLSEVMTRMLFTMGERSRGNMVMVTSNRLQYMTTAEKLNVSAQLADRGILNRDEVREIWNLAPLPDGAGQIYTIRGEYYNADEKLTEAEEESDE